MPQIQLRLSFYFFLLLFSLIACQPTTSEPKVVPTETVAALSSTEESEGESNSTTVPESTEVDESDSAESTEVAEDEKDSVESSEMAEDESYPAPQPEEAEVVEEVPYPPPPPEINVASTAYPEPQETEIPVESDSYPAPDEVITATPSPTLLSGERFELSPLQAGDTEVRGRGPAGLPIALVDVSLAGDLITTGKIEEDGTFVIKVPQPLESDHHLGLRVGPLYGTPFADQEEVVMQDARLLLGEYGFDLPSIGLIVTSRRVP